MFSYYNDVDFLDKTLSVDVAPYYYITYYVNLTEKRDCGFFIPVEFTTPTIECADIYKLGCWLVAQYILSIKFRTPVSIKSVDDANNVNITNVKTLYDDALALDVDLGISKKNKLPSLKSCLDSVHNRISLFNDKEPVYFNTLKNLKYIMGKYGPVLIETYYIESMKLENMKPNLFILKESENAVYNTYTKGYLCVGYDDFLDFFLVLDVLGLKFGNLGFLKIPYSVLNTKVKLPNGDSKRVFIKGAYFKNCLDTSK